jgi:hypothetical protein
MSELRLPTPSQKFPKLKPSFEALRKTREAHSEAAAQIIDSAPRELTLTDLFILGALKRSLDLVAAIEVLIEQWNYSAMAPLVRLQVDSLLRLHYIASFAERDHLIKRVVEGESFRNLRGKDGRRLTDARLLELAETEYPWVRSMYEDTSKVVHFTVGHLTVPLKLLGKPNVDIDMDIGLGRWSESRIRECLLGTATVSNEILRIAHRWTHDRPEKAR